MEQATCSARDGADGEPPEFRHIAPTVTIRDFGGKEFLSKAMAGMFAGDELHLADVIGEVEAVEEVPSAYPDPNGKARNNVLLRGLFETTFASGREKILSLRAWLPGDFPRRIARYFKRLAPGKTLAVVVSVYAIKLADRGRQCPYCYKVRVGTLAQQPHRELRRVRSQASVPR